MHRRPLAIVLLTLFLDHSAGDVWEAGRPPPRATPSSPCGDDDFFPLALAYRQEALEKIALPDTIPYAPAVPALSPPPLEPPLRLDPLPDTSPRGPDLVYSLMSLRC